MANQYSTTPDNCSILSRAPRERINIVAIDSDFSADGAWVLPGPHLDPAVFRSRVSIDIRKSSSKEDQSSAEIPDRPLKASAGHAVELEAQASPISESQAPSAFPFPDGRRFP